MEMQMKSSKPHDYNGQMVRASASGAVNSGLIPSRVKPPTKIAIYSFYAWRLALKG